MRPDFTVAQIATGDLDIRILCKLAAANLPLGDEFEPGSVKMVGFEAAFRHRGLWKQDLEHASGNAHHALILAHPDAELDDGALRVPPGVGRKAEEHEIPPVEATENVRIMFSNAAPKGKGLVERFAATDGSTPLGYLFCVKPKYARAPATGRASQLTQNGMLKPPISTCHPKMIRSRCIIATTRNSVAAGVEFTAHSEAGFGGSGRYQLDDHPIADEWLGPPVLADEGEEAVFDFVPLAGAGRQVADRDVEAELVGQLLEFAFPQPHPRAVAASAPGLRRGRRGGDQQSGRLGIARPTDGAPPLADAIDGERGRVMVNADTQPELAARS